MKRRIIMYLYVFKDFDLYFLFELSNEFCVYIENPLEMINNVEIKKICFK